MYDRLIYIRGQIGFLFLYYLFKGRLDWEEWKMELELKNITKRFGESEV